MTIVAGNVATTVAITGAPASSPEGTAIVLGSIASDPGMPPETLAYIWNVTKIKTFKKLGYKDAW